MRVDGAGLLGDRGLEGTARALRVTSSGSVRGADSDVEESGPVNRDYLDARGPLGDVVSAAGLEVPEIERALAGLAEHAADRSADRLRKGW